MCLFDLVHKENVYNARTSMFCYLKYLVFSALQFASLFKTPKSPQKQNHLKINKKNPLSHKKYHKIGV